MIPKKFLISVALVISALALPHSAQQAKPAPAPADLDYQVGAILYQQKAAEYRALAYQAFNLARLRLEQELGHEHGVSCPQAGHMLPRAIVVDIDETMLDNSPANAKNVADRRPFNTEDWYKWGEMEKAKPVPGAVDFINYAVSEGVKVFYISNRDEVQKKATINNLIKAGFADVSADNVYLRTEGSGKEPRRKRVSDKYRIVMLIGDNLDDFTEAFERKSVADRFAETDRARHEFGKRFIVLPNAMYGTWESAVYEFQRLTEEQKAQKRARSLELP